jgi:hypothetical protein
MFKGQSYAMAVSFFTVTRILFWMGVAGVLHYNRWYYAL